MAPTKNSLRPTRGEPIRNRILDAAEQLLREGKADFSMRDLAARAAVSFATPFNHFGSKTLIMYALSARLVEAMGHRYRDSRPTGDAVDRLFIAIRAGASVMLLEPEVNRTVMASLGAVTGAPGAALAQSAALWRMAIGDGDGLAEASREPATSLLPELLAFGFRGVLSFWTAGEIADGRLPGALRNVAASIVLGFVDDARAKFVMSQTTESPGTDAGAADDATGEGRG